MCFFFSCSTEFGFYQTGESNAQPFSKRITLDWFVQQCADIYGIPGLTPNTDGTNQVYIQNSCVCSNRTSVEMRLGNCGVDVL